jgi:hypothetical protein
VDGRIEFLAGEIEGGKPRRQICRDIGMARGKGL